MNTTVLNKVHKRSVRVIVKEFVAGKKHLNLSDEFSKLFIVPLLLPYVMEGRG